jgi:hypothetical protein
MDRGQGQAQGRRPKPTLPICHVPQVRVVRMERCHNCDQELIEIDNRGQRLTGCLTCNLWSAGDRKRWTRLSEEDLRALHLLRHGGAPKTK